MLASTLIFVASLLGLGWAAPAPGVQAVAVAVAGAAQLEARGHAPPYDYGEKPEDDYYEPKDDKWDKPTIHKVTVGKSVRGAWTGLARG